MRDSSTAVTAAPTTSSDSAVTAQLDLDSQRERQKVNILEFILHQHSLLGLCFAGKGPPPILVGGCCVCADALSRRHRLFVLGFVLVATLTLSVRANLGDASWTTVGLLSFFVVMPCTCLLKSAIRDLSSWLQRVAPTHRCVRLRAEELALLAWLAIVFVDSAVRHSPKAAGEGVSVAVLALGAQWVAEVVQLFWCYFFCACCCRCCVPTKGDLASHARSEDPSHCAPGLQHASEAGASGTAANGV